MEMEVRRKYTAKHLEFLRTRYAKMLIPELTRAFNAKFGMNQTECSIHAALANNKITCGRKTGKTRGRYRLFTQKQARFVRKNYLRLTIPELTSEFNRRYGTEMTVQQIRSFTRNHSIRSGRTGCFEKGHKSWNKGTKGLTGANSGSFKPGNKPASLRPVGAERIDSKDGYILIKVAQPDPYTGFQTRFRQKHVIIWEQEHGPVPAGMIVAFVDGNKANCDINNLMLISRAELLLLNINNYTGAPAELKPSVLALTKLEVKIFSHKAI